MLTYNIAVHRFKTHLVKFNNFIINLKKNESFNL